MWDNSLGPPLELTDVLAAAWLRRKRLEAKIQALEIGIIIGELFGGKQKKQERISANEMFAMLGQGA